MLMMKLLIMISPMLVLLLINVSSIDAYSVYISRNVSCQLNVGLITRTLDCSNRELESIPDFSKVNTSISIINITAINLSENKLKRLDMRNLNIFARLENIDASRNNLSKLNVAGYKIPNKIRSLNLERNIFREIPGALRRFFILEEFKISQNLLTVVKNDTFRGLNRLRKIHLFEYNGDNENNDKEKKKNIKKTTDGSEKARFITVETSAFRHMPSLKKLDLLSAKLILTKFPDLDGTDNLMELYVEGIKNLEIYPRFCENHRRLHTLFIGRCSGRVMPSFSQCKSLEKMELAGNKFDSIGNESFSRLPNLENLGIDQHGHFPTIHPDAFNYLPKLRKLDLSHFPLNKFPNFVGADSLVELDLEGSRVNHIPEHLCVNAPLLSTLHLMRNRLRTLPSFSKCSKLDTLNLNGNFIKDLTTQFRGLKRLEYLSMNDNLLTYLPESLLGDCRNLKFLYLRDNHIREIHPNGFANNTELNALDVTNNFLKKLPYKGLITLKEVKASGNPHMIDFPTQQELPRARMLQLNHAYHCCFFLQRVQQITRRFKSREMKSSWNASSATDMDDQKSFRHSQIILKFFNRNKTFVDNDVDPLLQLLRQLNDNINITAISTKKPSPDHEEQVSMSEFFGESPYCTPTPNEFYPCDDLMGEEWLRFCVWAVFLFAVFGNGIVLFVMFSNYAKLDVPQFLVLNLSMADLLLGVYLGFLAFVDIKTIGDFRSHALDWQYSGMCQLAGFIAVFSSELSVFTLTAITMERFLTIKNCMYAEKRLSRRQIYLITAFGWLFAAFVAALPLVTIGGVKFNDYSKYSVCLPFETSTLASKVYLVVLLSLNLLAFLVILFCYVKIYLFIRNSHAWNSGDSLVARRVAILVFTDFLCWFPISIIALSTVLGQPLIQDLWISKVITVFIFPLNACANPFLYAITKKRFRKDIMSATRRLKEKLSNNGEIRRSLLRLPIKGSLTYSTSVRRESSCSFLFSRRHSAKHDQQQNNDALSRKQQTPILQASTQQSHCDEHDEDDFQERLTTV